jgi:hypothetical protein
MTTKSAYRKQVLAEVEAVPPEYLPFLLMITLCQEKGQVNGGTRSALSDSLR